MAVDKETFRVTSLQAQSRNKNRVNVFINDAYRFSVDLSQLLELGIRVGVEYSEHDIINFEQESEYKKLYERSLAYVLVRPRAEKEVKDYLYRKTFDTLTKKGGVKKGVSTEFTERVFQELVKRGYVNDERFANYWVENRSLRKGASLRTLKSELQKKGVSVNIIDNVLGKTERSDKTELEKVIAKRKHHYSDEKKFIMYLLGRGFMYDDIQQALQAMSTTED